MKKLFKILFLYLFTWNALATFTAFPPQTSGTSTLDIAQARFYGSVKWSPTTGCVLSRASTVLDGGPPANTSCDDNVRVIRGTNNITSGAIGNSDGQKVQIKFDSVPSGVLKCSLKAFFYNDTTSSEYFVAFNDGTTTTPANTIYQTGGGSLPTASLAEGEFHYNSDQGPTTVETFIASTVGTSYIEANSFDEEIEFSCFHYPSESKVFQTTINGLDAVNTFSAKITHTSGSTTVDSENVDWIESCDAADEPVCTFKTSLFSSAPNCVLTPQGGSTTKFSSGIKALSASSITLQAAQNSFTTFSGGATYTAYQLHCQRSGDFRVFDDRYVPIAANRSEGYIATLDSSENVTGVSQNTISETGTVTTSGTFSFTPKKDVTVNASLWTAINSTGAALSIIYYNTSAGSIEVGRGINNASATYNTTTPASATFNMKAGETMTVAIDGTSTVDVALLNFTVRPVENHAYIANADITNTNKTPNTTNPVMYSTYIGTGGVLAKETGDWIDGDCTNAHPSVCTLKAGAFSSEPNCVVSAVGTGNVTCEVEYYTGTTNFAIRCFIASTAAAFTTTTQKQVICHGVQ